MKFDYYMPTKLLFGPGKLDDLVKEPIPWKKALIAVSAGNSLKRNGSLDRLKEILQKKGVGYVLYDKITPNPVRSHVMEGAALARQEGCDFVIGFGGGSSIDSAKSIAMMAKNPGDYWDYVSGGTGKGLPIQNGALPIVAITTTAGTGSEVNPYTVITKEETNEKIGIGSNDFFPILAIVDPELMLTIPSRLTAYQGFDALFHATEGYIANTATPIGDSYALKSIELIANYLPICVKDGSNLVARTQVALANTLSGFVESTSRGASAHSMEHALSAHHPDLTHGAGLIMLAEAYYTFFADKVPERFIKMARAMGVDVDALPEAERPLSFVRALLHLQEECDVSDLTMSDYGIQMEDMPILAEDARRTMGSLFALDPYELSMEETVEIMRNAYK